MRRCAPSQKGRPGNPSHRIQVAGFALPTTAAATTTLASVAMRGAGIGTFVRGDAFLQFDDSEAWFGPLRLLLGEFLGWCRFVVARFHGNLLKRWPVVDENISRHAGQTAGLCRIDVLSRLIPDLSRPLTDGLAICPTQFRPPDLRYRPQRQHARVPPQ